MAYEETPRDVTRHAVTHSPRRPGASPFSTYPVSTREEEGVSIVCSGSPTVTPGYAGVTVGLPCAAVLENPAQHKCTVGVGGETTGLWGEGQDW